MQEMGYRYTICYDTGVNLNMSGVSGRDLYQSFLIYLYRKAKINAKRIMKMR